MNKQIILDTLENPAVLEQEISRREALRGTGSAGIALAIAASPFILAATARRLFAQGLPTQIINVLNFALILEYLEAEFYQKGLDAAGLIPDDTRDVFMQISKHETAHVAFLEGVLGSRAAKRPPWDFTAGGMFSPFTDYQQFLILSQGFEDTGVRAYKGQAGNLQSNDDILTAALRIHSVEARHAAEVRRIREKEAWITGAQTDVAALQPVYAGEDQVVQLGIDTSKYLGFEAATEAFDEPLGLREVLAIAGLFGTG